MRQKDKNEQRKTNIPENDPSKAMDSKREVEKSPDNKTDQDFPGYPHYPAKEDIMDQRTDTHRVDMDMENMSNARNVTGVSQRFGGENSSEGREGETPDEEEGEDFRDINPRTDYSRADRNSQEAEGAINAEIGIPQNVENTDMGSHRPGTDLEDEDTSRGRDREGDVTPEERAALSNMYMPTDDEENLRRSALDTTDFDGDQLNEDSFGEVLSSTDLDIPDEGDETTSTSLGQGDEENKYYSLGGDRQARNEEDPYSGPARGNYEA
ncbi:MAG TPA: hypothetical protein VGE66_07660 [Chitinophagaceae bacterium]